MEAYFHTHYRWLDLIEVWCSDSGARMGQFKTKKDGIFVNLPMREVSRL